MSRVHFVRPVLGSPYPINNGASTRTLWRRAAYGGKKGRAARRRLRALERRVAPYVHTTLARDFARVRSMLEGVERFAGLDVRGLK